MMTLIEFECRGHRFGLPLRYVRRVVHSASPTPLPGAPDIVLGMLNVAGDLVIVVDFPRRIGLPSSSIDISQQLLLIDISGFSIGFIVDSVQGVVMPESSRMPRIPDRYTAAPYVESVLRLEDGLCVILDPEKFLFEDEKDLLGNVLEKIGHEMP